MHPPQSCSALYPLFLANTANGTGKSQWLHSHLLEVEVICLMNIADGWIVEPPPGVHVSCALLWSQSWSDWCTWLVHWNGGWLRLKLWCQLLFSAGVSLQLWDLMVGRQVKPSSHNTTLLCRSRYTTCVGGFGVVWFTLHDRAATGRSQTTRLWARRNPHKKLQPQRHQVVFCGLCPGSGLLYCCWNSTARQNNPRPHWRATYSV